ncbi:MAG: ribosomal protein L28 [Candidatus Xenolissoclinum pacificiensis L6]|uniref:Large ribosomal subunit protein bL28 n=1 Tax=Candidatus Xenolissoclinum pacificiensis L6 TaxID=1401685 RepID=W2UZ58_9RICK|nr:MAG: ribosomal protein L28 [Candidatus Xenolissoclinum pacificiensis L6]
MSSKCDIYKCIKPRTGNKVSHSNIKTGRWFRPNIRRLSFESKVLNKVIKLNVATRTLRTIYHKHGLDNFLLNTRASKLTDKALSLKRQIRKKLSQTQDVNQA